MLQPGWNTAPGGGTAPSGTTPQVKVPVGSTLAVASACRSRELTPNTFAMYVTTASPPSRRAVTLTVWSSTSTTSAASITTGVGPSTNAWLSPPNCCARTTTLSGTSFPLTGSIAEAPASAAASAAFWSWV